MFNTYKDRSWCIRSPICAHTPCDRRLSKSDLHIIKEKNLLIAYDSFMNCKDFKEKENNVSI